MREALVKSDLIECVLGLGEGLFYNSPMPAAVVILRSVKPSERTGKILLINAVAEVAREQAQSFLREEHQHKILDAYREFSDAAGFAKVAAIDEIAEKGFSLAIPLYVSGGRDSASAVAVDVDEALSAWRAAGEASDAAISGVLGLLRSGVGR